MVKSPRPGSQLIVTMLVIGIDYVSWPPWFEYLLQQSGRQFEVNKTTKALGITQATVVSHVSALEITLPSPWCGPSTGVARARFLIAAWFLCQH